MSDGNVPRNNESITLGMLIDGFYRLSPQDTEVFLRATGLSKVPSVPSSYSAAATSSQVPVFPALGALTPTTAQSVVLPPGKTQDPKTGRVFTRQEAKSRSEERKQLETAKEKARKELVGFSTEHKIVLTQDGTVCYADGVSSDVKSRHKQLTAAYESAKDALNAYKSEHKEEFAPPVSRRGRGGLRGGRGRGI